eukprot:3443802-Lingulodinium_polyedra.AAC.1
MGRSGRPLAALCKEEQIGAPVVAHCPAVTLVDQEKAFERIGHDWLGQVLRRWHVPAWLLNTACPLVCGRTAVARTEL